MHDPAFRSPGRFLKGNIHAHSTCSDGALSPEEVVSLYRSEGYDFVAVTDHFSSKYGFPITDTTGQRTPDFTTLIGAELHAPRTSLGEKWHILAVGLPQGFEKTREDETAVELARRAHAAGAFIAIAHPAWYGLTLEDMQSLDVAHGIEIYNHRSAKLTSRGDSTSHVDQLHAIGRRIGVIAVDDAHFKSDDSMGGFVMVKASDNTPEDLLAALKAQHYYASQGPVIEDVIWAADHVEIVCSPIRVAMVLSRGSRAVYDVGENVTWIALQLNRIKPHGYGRVVVIDREGRHAWTNPVWW